MEVNKLKILVKFPTRNRGHKFVSVLSEYINKSTDNTLVKYLISYDSDDISMNAAISELIKAFPLIDITFVRGESKNKIHACNRDVNEYSGDWDIIALGSDDMLPQIKGWDFVIREEMIKNFPDLDGCLWFNDSHQPRVCTFSIMGKPYYNRFKYLYHPDYISLWCDNEFTDVAMSMGKMKYYEQVLFKHFHPAWMGEKAFDSLYRRNEAFFKQDQQTYLKRKAKGFK